MTGDERAALIRERLTLAFHPVSLVIEDESHLHAGHASAGGGDHFQVEIAAEAFAGKSAVQRHRMVYAALGDLMRGEVHAVGIRAHAPTEAG